jgi:hypothetical protein
VRDAVDGTAREALEQDAAVPRRDRQAPLLPVLGALDRSDVRSIVSER